MPNYLFGRVILVNQWGSCEGFHEWSDNEIPNATHVATKNWEGGIGLSMLLCGDCAKGYSSHGWQIEALQEEEEEMPYREEWENLYGRVPKEPAIDPGSFNPFS
jgi:hypothetical protein